MIIVDIRALTSGAIHSKFDANAVNDAEEIKVQRQAVEKDYEMYAKDTALLSDRNVIPCGSSVWNAALAALRKEKPGHYFYQCFPETVNALHQEVARRRRRRLHVSNAPDSHT